MPFKVNPCWFKDFFRKDFYNFDFIPPEKTKEEVDFILRVSGIKKDARILDVPCGIGRHSILLSKKGYEEIDY